MSDRKDGINLSDKDINFLVELGDSEDGEVARWEISQMYEIDVKCVEDFILKKIYGRDC